MNRQADKNYYRDVKKMNIIHPIKQNRGAVLFVSLIMLLTITILGLAIMSDSNIELKIALNNQEKTTAFQSAQAGIDTVVCLSDQTRTGTTNDNPFDYRYDLVEGVAADPTLQFTWDGVYDDAAPYYDVNPFDEVTQANCSLDDGAISNIPTSELNVSVRQTARKENCPRAEDGTSVGVLKCNSYVIDSRYEYAASGAQATIWSGLKRQVPGT